MFRISPSRGSDAELSFSALGVLNKSVHMTAFIYLSVVIFYCRPYRINFGGKNWRKINYPNAIFPIFYYDPEIYVFLCFRAVSVKLRVCFYTFLEYVETLLLCVLVECIISLDALVSSHIVVKSCTMGEILVAFQQPAGPHEGHHKSESIIRVVS